MLTSWRLWHCCSAIQVCGSSKTCLKQKDILQLQDWLCRDITASHSCSSDITASHSCSNKYKICSSRKADSWFWHQPLFLLLKNLYHTCGSDTNSCFYSCKTCSRLVILTPTIISESAKLVADLWFWHQPLFLNLQTCSRPVVLTPTIVFAVEKLVPHLWFWNQQLLLQSCKTCGSDTTRYFWICKTRSRPVVLTQTIAFATAKLEADLWFWHKPLLLLLQNLKQICGSDTSCCFWICKTCRRPVLL